MDTESPPFTVGSNFNLSHFEVCGLLKFGIAYCYSFVHHSLFIFGPQLNGSTSPRHHLLIYNLLTFWLCGFCYYYFQLEVFGSNISNCLLLANGLLYDCVMLVKLFTGLHNNILYSRPWVNIFSPFYAIIFATIK